MGIVDLLLECVELSYRPEAGGVKLREDIRNAYGYTFLVQFALTLSSLPQNQDTKSINSISPSDEQYTSEGSHALQDVVNQESMGKEDPLLQNISPTLSNLFDVFVNLAQTGQTESAGSKSSHTKASGHSRSLPPSIDRFAEEEHGNSKVKDLEAFRML